MQRRSEIIECSNQNLEESQSICGWDNASLISGSTLLIAFFSSTPSSRGFNDTASVSNMQSKVWIVPGQKFLQVNLRSDSASKCAARSSRCHFYLQYSELDSKHCQ
ncbi:hypothetical protein XELAEV_18015772mg [Xenopus laevis]|uniref:Uncharacterized protein n=1 Tax=Xenopus laevis TaxID=8355 RepID=A0A974DIM6_XENLA|nr:hypothetical protein XELAEV_18015772mg [Xenopus laevis]